MTIASAAMPIAMAIRTLAIPGQMLAATGRSVAAGWPGRGADERISMDDGGLGAGVHPFPSHRRMVLRETPCSRANALTFIEVVFDLGVGSGPISIFRGAVTRNAASS
jgi:hypothetical protein